MSDGERTSRLTYQLGAYSRWSHLRTRFSRRCHRAMSQRVLHDRLDERVHRIGVRRPLPRGFRFLGRALIRSTDDKPVAKEPDRCLNSGSLELGHIHAGHAARHGTYGWEARVLRVVAVQDVRDVTSVRDVGVPWLLVVVGPGLDFGLDINAIEVCVQPIHVRVEHVRPLREFVPRGCGRLGIAGLLGWCELADVVRQMAVQRLV